MPDGRTTSNGMARAVVILGGKNYDSAYFEVATGVSDYDLKTDSSTYKQNGNIFSNTEKHGAYVAEIRTSQDITIKFNDTDNDPYFISAEESPKVIPTHMRVDNIYVTNDSGQTAEIRIFLQ